ncbi:MAG: propanediol utilization protein [Chloroflexi bacterium HGW-Chloroflexi-1]|nr:MAG: propanediol utilization protein [Chloroflexi bacterium HGW-Chloroflexi-1]
MHPSLALIEFDSIAAGIEAGDAMAKKAPIARLVAGTVQPGKYLVLVAGQVADVEESLAAGLSVGAGATLDHVYLPGVHPHVVDALAGGRQPKPIAALGVVETRTVAAAIAAADAGIKGAEVTLLEVRLADGLGGRGLVFFSGLVADVEAAIRIATDVIAGTPALIHAVVIPQLHSEMAANLLADTRWRARAREIS